MKMPGNKNGNGKKVYIRPEDIVEYTLQLTKECKDLEELREHLHTMNYYLKHEKFDRLREEFGTP